MGITRLLFKYKLIYGLFVLLMVVCATSGCREKMVKYELFIEKPSAIKKGDLIEVNLGYTRASANWVKAFVKIEGDIIYISGELTFKEIPQTLSIKLPSPQKNYQVFWIDGDGKKTAINVQQQ